MEKKYKTEHKIIEGGLHEVEKRLNEESDKGFLPYGYLNATPVDNGNTIWYSILVSKVTEIKD